MKSYDQTVSTVFDRIHTYNVKKQHRATLARRVTASCCAVSLLGGGVWYLNHAPEDAPVTMITDGNADAATTTNTTKATETTTTEKILITASAPDTYSGNGYDSIEDIDPISPLLKEQMELCHNTNTVYSVLVAVQPTREEDLEHPENNKELLQLWEQQLIAGNEYQAILNRDNPNGPLESGKYIHSEEAKEKYDIFLNLARKWEELRDQLYEEYYAVSLNRKVEALTALSITTPIKLSSVPGSSHINTVLHFSFKGHGYSAILSAKDISSLVKQGGYVFWLNSSEGDYSYSADDFN